MSFDICDLYKSFLVNNKNKLFDKMCNVDVFFRKKMKNLIYGTNRSIFLTTTGKENESVEKWFSGKPINRVNIRATIANFFPDNVIDSIYINTYKDERELKFYIIIDNSANMYPSQFVCGVDDPYKIKIVYSLYVQSMLLYLAGEYDLKTSLIYYPGEFILPINIDTKKQGTRILFNIFKNEILEPVSAITAFDYLFKKNIKHSIIAVISDESAFSFSDRSSFLEKLSSFSITNDIIYFPITTNYKELLNRASGPMEINLNDGSYFITSEKEKNTILTKIENRKLNNLKVLNDFGIQTCPVETGKNNWIYKIVDFFKRRLVLR